MYPLLMSISQKTVDLTVPADIDLTPKERLSILHISYLAIAADRNLSEEEIAAFALLASRLLDKPMSPSEAGRMLGGFETHALPKAELTARLRTLAGELRKSPRYVQEFDPDITSVGGVDGGDTTSVPGPRHIAYRVAYALAMCDMATSDEEFEFDLDLLDALELTPNEGESLAADVLNAMSDEE